MGTLNVDGGTYSTLGSALTEIEDNQSPLTEDWTIDIKQNTSSENIGYVGIDTNGYKLKIHCSGTKYTIGINDFLLEDTDSSGGTLEVTQVNIDSGGFTLKSRGIMNFSYVEFDGTTGALELQTNDNGVANIYNNIIVDNFQIRFGHTSNATPASGNTYNIYNNVFCNNSGTNWVLHLNGVMNVNMQNNLFVQLNALGPLFKINGHSYVGGLETVNLTNNLYAGANLTNAWTYDGANYSTYAAWASAASETDGSYESDYSTVVNSAPTDFTLVPDTSPAFNAGTTIGLVTDDILGIERPQYSSYDIGPYEQEATAPLLCWSATALYNNGRAFQTNGPGKFPTNFSWPNTINPETKVVIEDGNKII